MPLNGRFRDGNFERDGFLRRGKRKNEERVSEEALGSSEELRETHGGERRRSARVRSWRGRRFGSELTHVGEDEEFDVEGPAGELHGREEESCCWSSEELQSRVGHVARGQWLSEEVGDRWRERGGNARRKD